MPSDAKRLLGFVALLALAGCGENQTIPPDRDAATDPDAGKLTCIPNLDGKIDASELKATLGIPVSYLVSPSGEKRTVDLVGQSDGQGHRLWDFSQDFASDTKASITATALEGKWYAASFPKGQFVTPIDVEGLIEGVYMEDDSAFSLLGVASHDENPKLGKTLLVYDAPIELYRFPLEPGATWISAGTVENGLINGLAYAGKDTYEVKDDGLGQLDLKDFTFKQAHRVQTTVTLQPAAGASKVTRQDSFMFECFGEIVRVTSLPDEKQDDFTTASEVRRLGQ